LVASAIAATTVSSAREPVKIVYVPWQLIRVRAPMLSKVGTGKDDRVLVLGDMVFILWDMMDLCAC
jgi:hypothetical protein